MVKLREMRLLHMDVKCLPHMADGTQRSFLFVAIDRATCCMSVQFKSGRTARSANGCLTALHKACPHDDSETVDLQRQGVHRPAPCQPRRRTQWSAWVRLICSAGLWALGTD